MAGKVNFQQADLVVSEMIKQMEAGALVSYTASYAKYVEFPTSYAGTQPPFDPIFEWVDRKWPDLSDGLTTDSQGAPLTRRQVAWKVVNIIAEHGTEGVYFGRRGLDTAKQAAPSIAGQYEGSNDPQAPEKIVAEVAETGFNKSQAIISQEATDTGNLLQSGQVELVDDIGELPEVDMEVSG